MIYLVASFNESHEGLRQGENVSPLLFALFLNDMETFFSAQKWNTIKCVDKLYNYSSGGINAILHDMQKNLDLLNKYCLCNKLKVNISNTKMMIFARSKTMIHNICTFKFGNTDLDQVEDYVYLGICFNWNGSFVKAKRLLRGEASKAI